MKGKRKRGRQKKRWEDNIKEWTEMDLPAQLGQLKTGQDGKGLLQIHLWCPDNFQGYGIEQNRIEFITDQSNCLCAQLIIWGARD